METMENKIKVYYFDQLYLSYKGVNLYVYLDNLYKKIKYRLEDMNTENSTKYNFSKYILDNCTIEYYLKYIQKKYDYGK